MVLLNHTRERADYRDTVALWIQEAGGELKNKTFDSYWGLHIRDLAAFRTFLPNQTVNSMPGARAVFGDKDSLVLLQRQAHYELFAEEFTPPAYILPQELREFQNRNNPRELFARKKLNSHSGAGVNIMSANEVLVNANNKDVSFVVQKYITDSLLIEQRKFDVRWWAVIMRNGPTKLKGFMFHDGYAKVACFGGSYDAHNVKNKCAHVTNSVVQRECASRNQQHKQQQANVCHNDHPRNVRNDAFQHAIAPVNGHTLFEGAKHVLEQALRTAAWRLNLQAQYSGAVCNTFQLLAIDVIYERDTVRPWLLEINLNGYLQSGLLKVPGAQDRMKEMLHYVGFLRNDSNKELHTDWVELNIYN